MANFSLKSGPARARARFSVALALGLFAIVAGCQQDAQGPRPGGTRLTPGGSGGTPSAGSGDRSTNEGGSGDLIPVPTAGTGDELPCNTWTALCARHYDEVVYPTTHAAMANASPPWDYPAQRFSLYRQLQDGIRALMLEVHDFEGELVLCLGDCSEGHVPFASALAEVSLYLAENPREVVTLLVSNGAPAEDLAAALQASDLTNWLHFQAAGESWPTLGRMIDEGQRLVVFATGATGASDGVLSFEEFFASTRDDYGAADELDCELPRGSAEKPLMLVNHFVSEMSSVAGSSGGAGGEASGGGGNGESASVLHALPDVAAIINENPFLIRRLRGCVATNARTPTFVAVDFYDVGALLPATQELDELIPPTGQ